MNEPAKPATSKKAALAEAARTAWRRLRGGKLTPARAAASVAVGLAIGVLPLWGVHWFLVLAICMPLRLDAGVAYLAANVSLPIFAPFITFAEVEVGARMLHGAWVSLTPSEVKNLALGTVAAEVALGTAVVSVASALTGGALTYGLVSLRKRS